MRRKGGDRVRVGMVAFTGRGLALALRIARACADGGDEVLVSGPERLAEGAGVEPYESLAIWAERSFATCDALVFVGACGIAVRAIAPHVRDKSSDPAVVCVDEAGSVAVPLLSGHVGGANALARRVAAIAGGHSAVSTATDVNGVFAVDVWAAAQGLALLDRDVAREVSAALLEGEEVGFVSDVPVAGVLPAGLVGLGSDRCPRLGILVSCHADRMPFARTLHLVPKTVTVGVGCKRGTDAASIADLVDACLSEARVAPQAVRALASIDLKADEAGLRALASERDWDLRFYTADELAAVPGSFSSSEFVQKTVGVDNVCERAACAEGGSLLMARCASGGVTVALSMAQGRLSFDSPCDDASRQVVCVGLGPGAGADMTYRARAALDAADVIVGYTSYIDLIRDDYAHKELVTTPMRREVERCRIALDRAAEGARVAVVCSGDPGVYGMAGLLLELAPAYPGVGVEVVPGVSAANGGAAVLGAPLMHDWCSISLSDLMTPWETIENRLAAAAGADFCIALYNPASHKRPDHLRRACDVLLAHKDPKTVCGIVRSIGRDGERSELLTLAELRNASVDMMTCVFVGNSETRVVDGRMVTPRGYLTRSV